MASALASALSAVAPLDASPAASPSAHDLPAELQARIALARDHLGTAAPAEIVSGVFAFVGAPPCLTFDAAVQRGRDATRALLNGRFVRLPDAAVTVYVFCAQAPYEAYCASRTGHACSSPLGLYEKETREAFVNVGSGLGTLTHELVHPILESDFPDAPDWLGEGIASLFEQPSLPRPGEIRGETNWRKDRLQRALRSPIEQPGAGLPALFKMRGHALYDGDRELHYATARYACQWLDDDRGTLWRFYRAWRAGVASDPTGEKAFEDVVGLAPQGAEKKWEAWVLGL